MVPEVEVLADTYLISYGHCSVDAQVADLAHSGSLQRTGFEVED